MVKKYKKDIILILIILIIAITLAVITSLFKTEGEYVKITIDDKVYGVYSIHDDTTLNLPTGNVLEIKDDKVYMSKSTCPDKVCVQHTSISSEGENIICLPNKVVVLICKEADDE